MSKDPENRFSLSFELSPFSLSFDYFFNDNNMSFTNKMFSLDFEFLYRYSSRFALSLSLGYNNYFDLSQRDDSYSIPIVVSSVFLFPIDKDGNLVASISTGAGMMISNFVESCDLNFLFKVGTGLSYSVSEHVSIVSKLNVLSTVPVKYLDESKERIHFIFNTHAGIAFDF